MTSQQYTERTARTDRRATVRRGIKKRGILPSFGDIVLPVVSVAAVGLLVLAGRQFFMNGLQTSPGITSTRAYADAPALIAEREKEQEQKATPPVTAQPTVQTEPETSEPVLAMQEAAPPVASVPVVAETPKPQPAKVTAPAPKPAPAKQAAPQKAAPLPTNKQWRIQVGAYGTKAAAQEAAKKIKKAGYKAEVYQNPASKHVKVWVYSGGADKKSAEKIVNAMKKLGFKSSFAFPPAKK